MKKISKTIHGNLHLFIGDYQDATYRCYLFGYRKNGATILFTYAPPYWLSRLLMRLFFGSQWFEVIDPFGEQQAQVTTGRNNIFEITKPSVH